MREVAEIPAECRRSEGLDIHCLFCSVMRTKVLNDTGFITTHQLSKVDCPFVVINPTPNLQLKGSKEKNG